MWGDHKHFWMCHWLNVIHLSRPLSWNYKTLCTRSYAPRLPCGEKTVCYLGYDILWREIIAAQFCDHISDYLCSIYAQISTEYHWLVGQDSQKVPLGQRKQIKVTSAILWLRGIWFVAQRTKVVLVSSTSGSKVMLSCWNTYTNSITMLICLGFNWLINLLHHQDSACLWSMWIILVAWCPEAHSHL